MTIAWFRDLVIVIFGLAAAIGVVLAIVFGVILYSRVLPIVDSMKNITRTLEKTISSVQEEIIKPLGQLAGFVQGFRGALGMLGRFRKRKEED